jgi:uncharacterized protein (TIGR02246 family)
MAVGHEAEVITPMLKATLVALIFGAAMAMSTARADDISDAAAKLAHGYDENYNRRDAAGMAALYATDGVLLSPGGKLIRGRAALEAYYKDRFASGAKDHESNVNEAHAMGDGGYGLGTFAVNVRQSDGSAKRQTGNIAYIYSHGADGWRLQAVVPSVRPSN